MKKIIKPTTGPKIPHAQSGKCLLERATEKIKERYDDNKPLVFNPIYRDEKIKQELLVKIQKRRCCYCEKDISDDYEVEHYRPKDGYKKGSKIEKPGYYWLTYTWSNLYYSCGTCNNLKGNEFPLIDPDKRAKNHYDDEKEESPKLIDLSVDDPKDFFQYIGLEIVPLKNENEERAIETIDKIQLDREGLFNARWEHFSLIQTQVKYLYNLAKGSELEEKAKMKCLEYLQEKAVGGSPFAMMIKCNIDRMKPFI
ncbi:MAG: TIGR02646 family protein [Flavobacteriales bacterium]|nr:TIGR02646 family protein [Flavobacteriales bacterium]